VIGAAQDVAATGVPCGVGSGCGVDACVAELAVEVTAVVVEDDIVGDELHPAKPKTRTTAAK
jgi:hypothetical protein